MRVIEAGVKELKKSGGLKKELIEIWKGEIK